MYLLYYIVGNEERYRSELVYSLLSLKKVIRPRERPSLKVLIYAGKAFDLPPEASFIEVIFITLTKKKIADWLRSANGHFFIVKPMILIEFSRVFRAPGILIDTDTFFIKSPVPLLKKARKGVFLIHTKECQFSELTGMFFFLKKPRSLI